MSDAISAMPVIDVDSHWTEPPDLWTSRAPAKLRDRALRVVRNADGVEQWVIEEDMVMGQVGTAFAARTERASLRSVGVFSNRLLLYGIAFELALSALIIYAPPLQDLLGTAALDPWMLLVVAPFPLIVWGADELRRWAVRRRGGT